MKFIVFIINSIINFIINFIIKKLKFNWKFSGKPLLWMLTLLDLFSLYNAEDDHFYHKQWKCMLIRLI